jgi:hypothetical protein
MPKNPAASALGKRRWKGVNAKTRTRHAKYAVEFREIKRREKKQHMRRELENAHLPSWLKAKLFKLRTGSPDEGRSYLDVGYHFGRYHIDDFVDNRDILDEISSDEALSRPSAVLRRIFASEAHPRGELTDFIPRNRRRDFLLGILAGANEESPGDYWLSQARPE